MFASRSRRLLVVGFQQSGRTTQRYLCQPAALELPPNLILVSEPPPKRKPDRFQEVDLSDPSVFDRTVVSLGSPFASEGSVSLDPSIWGNEPRIDILHNVVRWQLAKRRQGTHAAKNRGAVSGGGKKPKQQKGTGTARQGTTRAPQMRGGGRAFPPGPRDYSFKLNKKVRKMGLKHVLSAKMKEGKLVIVDSFKLETHKTAELKKLIAEHDWASAVFIDGTMDDMDGNFRVALGNIPKFDILPVIGANVYDILRKEVCVVSVPGLEGLEERLSD